MRTRYAFSLITLLLLAGAGVVLANQPEPYPGPSKTHYFVNPAEGIAEVVLPADATYDLSNSPWKEVTLDDLHQMGYLSPSEYEEQAMAEGAMWWQEETDGTRESRWYTIGTGSGGLKWVQTGAKSERVWTWPGRTYAKTSMYRDGQFVTSTTVNWALAWCAKAVSWQYKWYDGTGHWWDNQTEHWYGSSWIYGNAPDLWW